MCFWNNLKFKRLESQIILKSMGASIPNGMNTNSKFDLRLHLCEGVEP